MRLICPNCDAQYEVDDAAIPETGRDVQCSNCGHAWFQIRETPAEDLTEALYREPEPESVRDVPAAIAQSAYAEDDDDDEEDAPPPPRAAPVPRTLDESVLAILREEAERELAARKAESQSNLEMQSDLGLPPPVSPAVGSAAAAAADWPDAELGGDPAAQPVTGGRGVGLTSRLASRRDLLPDIEEINSSLRPNDAAQRSEALAQAREDQQAASGFRSGFVLVLVLAGLAAMLYVMAPQISAQIPGTAKALGSYVAAVDALRLSIDGLMQRATGALNGLTSN